MLKEVEIENEPEDSDKSEMDLEEDGNFEKNHDIDFLIYKRNVKEDNHILRYCFDSKSTPLFFSSFGKFDINNI